MGLNASDLEKIKAYAERMRGTGSLGNIRYADLIELLISDNKAAGAIRGWLQKNIYKPDMAHYIPLFASLIVIAGKQDKWESATRGKRKIHADKVAVTARKLAMLINEDVKPYYSKHITMTATDKIVRLDYFLEELAKHAERAIDEDRPLKVMDSKRLFARKLSAKINEFISYAIGEKNEVENHKLIAACIAVRFNEEARASEEVARMLGKR